MKKRQTSYINSENGVGELKKIKINGVYQWLLIRGEDRDNPIILFLHGGPGTSQIGYISPYQRELEKNYIVVNWDQRGSGLSYTSDLDQNTMNIQQFVEDTRLVIHHLKEYFNKKKIYIIGHSWGSLLGMKVIQKYPYLVERFVGIGQVTNWWEMEKFGYDYVLRVAKEQKVDKAQKELINIGEPPYQNALKDIQIQRKWIGVFGGTTKNIDIFSVIIEGMEKGTEYTEEDIEEWKKGTSYSFIQMHGELFNTNLRDEIKEIEIPIAFFAGRYDYNTPSSLAEEYLNELDAPLKKFVWFEQSAHFPFIEEPKEFSIQVHSFFNS